MTSNILNRTLNAFIMLGFVCVDLCCVRWAGFMLGFALLNANLRSTPTYSIAMM